METQTSKWRTGRLRVVAAVMTAVAALTLQPATPAHADTFANDFYPYHWGPNPYWTVPAENPYYKAIILIDNTGDPSLSPHIQLMTQVVNSLHNSYNGNYPVIMYYQDIHMAAGNPCAQGPAQFLILCKDETLGGTGSPTAPGSAGILLGLNNHIYSAVGRFRPSVMDPLCTPDKFSLVVQIMSNTLGLDYNLTNTASAMFKTITVGQCIYKGWLQGDLDRMNLVYNHKAG